MVAKADALHKPSSASSTAKQEPYVQDDPLRQIQLCTLSNGAYTILVATIYNHRFDILKYSRSSAATSCHFLWFLIVFIEIFGNCAGSLILATHAHTTAHTHRGRQQYQLNRISTTDGLEKSRKKITYRIVCVSVYKVAKIEKLWLIVREVVIIYELSLKTFFDKFV